MNQSGKAGFNSFPKPRPPVFYELQDTRMKKSAIIMMFYFCLIAIQTLPSKSSEPDPKNVTTLRLPCLFVKNEGQWKEEIVFAALRGGSACSFSKDGITLSAIGSLDDMCLNIPREICIARKNPDRMFASLHFVNASPLMQIIPEDKAVAYSNFYLSNDKSRWRTNVANFSKLLYKNVWNNIDIEYYEKDGALHQDIIIRPGGKTSDIRIGLNSNEDNGHSNTPFTLTGAVDESCKNITVDLKTTHLARKTVTTVLADSAGSGFVYLSTEFQTFFGGSVNDPFLSLQVDEDDNMYLYGNTTSPDLPVKNAFQSSLKVQDAFVAKIACDGNTLLFSTYYGGSKDEFQPYNYSGNKYYPCQSSASYSNRSIYITGQTHSIDLPVTDDALDRSWGSWKNRNVAAFLTRFDSSGYLLYGSYIGSSQKCMINCVKHDREGNIYCSIVQDFVKLPYNTANSLYPAINDSSRGKQIQYILKLTSSCDSVRYCTYFPDKTITDILGYMEVDDAGYAVIAESIQDIYHLYPSVNAFQDRPKGTADNIYIARIDPMGSTLVYATFCGGSTNVDILVWLSVDKHGNAYLTGTTLNRDYPMMNPVQNDNNGIGDGFITKISPDGALLFSSFAWGTNTGLLPGVIGNNLVDGDGNVFLLGGNGSKDYPHYNQCTGLSRSGTAGITVTDTTMRIKYSSDLIHNISPGMLGDLVHYSKRGYAYFKKILGTNPMNFPISIHNGYQQNYYGKACGLITRLYLPLCDQKDDTVFSESKPFTSCALSFPDSIQIDRKLHIVVPKRFAIIDTVENVRQGSVVSGIKCSIELPPGLVLEPTNQSIEKNLSPPSLAYGQTGAAQWDVLVDTVNLKDSILTVRVYPLSTSGQDCPQAVPNCSKNIKIKYFDVPKLSLECSMDCADTLYENAERTGLEGNGFVFGYYVRNTGKSKIKPHHVSLRLPRGMGVLTDPPDDTLRTVPYLNPGAQFYASWTLRAKPRSLTRTAGLSVVVVDTFGIEQMVCDKAVHIMSVAGLKCEATGTDTLRFDISTGRYLPDPYMPRLKLTNLLDTLQSIVETEADLSAVPNLAFDLGEVPRRVLHTLDSCGTSVSSWRITVASPGPASGTVILQFRTLDHHEWRQCSIPVTITAPAFAATCHLSTGDTLGVSLDRYAPNPFPIEYVIQNPGKFPIPTKECELSVDPALLVSITEPLIQSIPALQPGSQDTLVWHGQVSTSRFNRDLKFSVVARINKDTLVSSCTKKLFLPGIPNDLVCSITAPDTLHYNVATDTYTQNPFPCTLTLDNKLDTAQQVFETMIDLSAAPHLKLAAGEQAQKQIASIAAHGSAPVSWQLEVAATAQAPVSEQVVVWYRHSGDTTGQTGRTCRTSLTLEGQKRIFAATCATAGTDSIWLLEDRTVPLFGQVQYTISNNGNVPLTGCSAAIVLPKMFHCVNTADSIQSFGIIQPGTSVWRQWLITVNLSLAQLAQQAIGWNWSCDSLQSVPPCEHHIQPVLGEPSRIVLNPWKLRFRAEQNGVLPAAQQVEMYEIVTASIFWQLQSATPWIDFMPTSGSQTALIDVRPNTTVMPVALYTGTIGVTPAPFVSPQSSIQVEYEIYKITPTERTPTARNISLSQNYPNPVRSGQSTTIRFTLEKDDYASIKLYDLLGRFVATVFDGNVAAGMQSVWFEPSSPRPGVYTYVLIAGEKVYARKMVVTE
jgi:hypothetical protein